MADKKATSKAVKTTKSTKSAKKSNKKPNVFKRIWNYLRECKGELKKVTWTPPKVATKNFFIVLVVILVAGLFIFALDRGLFALLGLVMNTSST
jgi:preprotein translocase subunit SecE